MSRAKYLPAALIAAFAALISSAALAENGTWLVRKSSGEVWTTSSDVQQASLTQDGSLQPGDTIRTGRNGRVLLVRGEEQILISPNSIIGIPAEKTSDRPTTIQQQAGSILLEVEKRNVQHFEVETPYLAAVVKGTQFRVSVTPIGAKVEVVRGQVEVADFKSGQIAQILPGQSAQSSSSGHFGLSLGGAGTPSVIQNGNPRAPTIQLVPVPKGGLAAPRSEKGHVVRALVGRVGAEGLASGFPTARKQGAVALTKSTGVRISSALGEVRLNVHRATNGLARSPSSSSDGSRKANGSQNTL